jgi:hypothetical protein
MKNRTKKVVSVTLADRDRAKLDILAASLDMNRSETVRQLIRNKRQPKQALDQLAEQGDKNNDRC